MRQSHIDFNTIYQALSYTMEALKEEEYHNLTALEKLVAAQEELRQALSFSLSNSK